MLRSQDIDVVSAAWASAEGKAPLANAGQALRGYAYNDGGLSNQKLALLGLVVSASEGEGCEQRQIFLPHMCVKDQQNTLMTLVKFKQIFEEKIFIQFLKRWDIHVFEEAAEEIVFLSDDERSEKRGWNYFGKGAGCLGSLSGEGFLRAKESIVSDFFRSLVPTIIEIPQFQKVGKLLDVMGCGIAAQLRIELDWWKFSHHSLLPTVGPTEDFYITAERIVSKIASSLPMAPGPIFVSCDEKFIFSPRAVITDKVRAETGREIVWKSDLLGDELADRLTPLEAALFDFEICIQRKYFVGNSRSTFSNLCAFERYVRIGQPLGHDYLYNVSGDTLGQRLDAGTHIDPYVACGLERPDPVVLLTSAEDAGLEPADERQGRVRDEHSGKIIERDRMRSDRINTIARHARARRYLEIGVSEGATFFDVEIPHKVAVDPRFMFDHATKANANTEFYPVPSDDFFRTVGKVEPFDIVYLDGLHTYEQTLRDFLNSLAFAHERTIWILDDTVPNDNFSALPDQDRCYRLRRELGNGDWAWMGDVFKVVFFIRNTMKHYRYRTFGGHGQTVIWLDVSGFDDSPSLPAADIGHMTYEDFREHYATMMNPASDEEIFADIAKFLGVSA